jgi:hypothetical protein
MRLSGQSSPGVRVPFTVLPDVSATGLSTGGTSPGVPVPYNARGGESPRPRRSPGGPPRFDPGVRRRVPPRRLRCRSQVFSTSQRLLPLSAAPPFSDGWRSWGSPFRGLILARSPGDSSSPAYPLDVAPAGCASPVLGGGIRGRDRRCLGDANGHLSRLQGLSSSCESVCVTSDFHPVVTDLPLLGFCLLMVYTSAGGRGSPL